MNKFPKIVYKYRNWCCEFHKKVLTHNQLFLSAPSDFNDPFDCRNSKNHLTLNNPKKVEKYIEKIISEQSDDLTRKGLNIEESKINLRKKLNDLEEYQNKYEKLNSKYTDKYLGVLSLSRRWNSILMWSHYGDSHKGYCIGFDEEKLRNTGFFGEGGNVTYSDKVPKISPFEDDILKIGFYQTHFKAKDWKYEKEYRLTKLFFDKPSENPIRLIKVPDDCIREVIIGMEAEEETKNDIIKICNDRKIPVYQAFKDSFEFIVKRKRMNNNTYKRYS